MDFNEALEKFGKAVGDLKRSYAEKEGVNPNYLSISIDDGDHITIIPTLNTGCIDCYRDWLDTD